MHLMKISFDISSKTFAQRILSFTWNTFLWHDKFNLSQEIQRNISALICFRAPDRDWIILFKAGGSVSAVDTNKADVNH